MSIIIFVGDIDSSLQDRALEYSPDAMLLDKNTEVSTGVYYASLADFDDVPLFIVKLRFANTIIYSPPDRWRDEDKNGKSKLRERTEFALLHFKYEKDVVGYELFEERELSMDITFPYDHRTIIEPRKTNGKQLWIVGCSYSMGMGVEEHERYGNIISAKTNLPVSFLTARGGSVEWAAQQIISADIRPDDIIIWGLTAWTRLPYLIDGQVEHLTPNGTKLTKQLEKLLYDENRLYVALNNIRIVYSMCERLNLNLIMGCMLADVELSNNVLHYKNVIPMTGTIGSDGNNFMLDVGDDGIHPGKLTHEWYADRFLKAMETLKFI